LGNFFPPRALRARFARPHRHRARRLAQASRSEEKPAESASDEFCKGRQDRAAALYGGAAGGAAVLRRCYAAGSCAGYAGCHNR